MSLKADAEGKTVQITDSGSGSLKSPAFQMAPRSRFGSISGANHLVRAQSSPRLQRRPSVVSEALDNIPIQATAKGLANSMMTNLKQIIQSPAIRSERIPSQPSVSFESSGTVLQKAKSEARGSAVRLKQKQSVERLSQPKEKAREDAADRKKRFQRRGYFSHLGLESSILNEEVHDLRAVDRSVARQSAPESVLRNSILAFQSSRSNTAHRDTASTDLHASDVTTGTSSAASATPDLPTSIVPPSTPATQADDTLSLTNVAEEVLTDVDDSDSERDGISPQQSEPSAQRRASRGVAMAAAAQEAARLAQRIVDTMRAERAAEKAAKEARKAQLQSAPPVLQQDAIARVNKDRTPSPSDELRLREQVVDLTHQLSTGETLLLDMRRAYDAIVRERDEHKQLLHQLQGRYSSIEGESHTMKQTLQGLRIQLDTSEARAQQLESERQFAVSQHELDVLNQQALEQQLSTLVKEIQRLAGVISSHERELAAAQQQVNAMQLRSEESAKSATLMASIRIQEVQRSAADVENKLRHELQSVQQQLSDQMHQHQQTTTQAKEQLVQREHAIQEMQHRLQTLELEGPTHLQHKLQRQDVQLAELETQLKIILASQDQISTDAADSMQKLARAEDRVQALLAENDSLHKRLQGDEAAAVAHAGELAASRTYCLLLEGQVNELTAVRQQMVEAATALDDLNRRYQVICQESEVRRDSERTTRKLFEQEQQQRLQLQTAFEELQSSHQLACASQELILSQATKQQQQVSEQSQALQQLQCRLEAQRVELQQSIADLEYERQQHRQVIRALEEASTALSTMETIVQHTTDTIEQATSQHHITQSELAEAHLEITQLRAKLSHCEGQLRLLQEQQITAGSIHVQGLLRQHNQTPSPTAPKFASILATPASPSSSNVLEIRCEQLMQEKQRLQRALTTAAAEWKESQLAVAAANYELASTRTDVKCLENEVQRLRSEVFSKKALS
eukprot:TRINITY_DN9804_c0_g1_i2.p1 TRINITY_DN9804_c0_g1~~TRINITY_DN9804_c0_g1_i2.p1  ORF type:complete len:972 (+),score=209.09 TRINITY_DN9804_c0_g1_i2:2662-5577(+)